MVFLVTLSLISCQDTPTNISFNPGKPLPLNTIEVDTSWITDVKREPFEVSIDKDGFYSHIDFANLDSIPDKIVFRNCEVWYAPFGSAHKGESLNHRKLHTLTFAKAIQNKDTLNIFIYSCYNFNKNYIKFSCIKNQVTGEYCMFNPDGKQNYYENDSISLVVNNYPVVKGDSIMGKYTYIGRYYGLGSSGDSIIATVDNVGFFSCKIE